jgi:hypothetical protein
MSVRAEADRNRFHGLRRSRSKLPFRHRAGSAFGQDGIAASHFHIGDFSVRTNRDPQTNQASDLRMLQQFGVFRLYRDQHFAIGFGGFLGSCSGREPAQDRERQNRQGGNSPNPSLGLWNEMTEQDQPTTTLRTESTPKHLTYVRSPKRGGQDYQGTFCSIHPLPFRSAH